MSYDQYPEDKNDNRFIALMFIIGLLIYLFTVVVPIVLGSDVKSGMTKTTASVQLWYSASTTKENLYIKTNANKTFVNNKECK